MTNAKNTSEILIGEFALSANERSRDLRCCNKEEVNHPGTLRWFAIGQKCWFGIWHKWCNYHSSIEFLAAARFLQNNERKRDWIAQHWPSPTGEAFSWTTFKRVGESVKCVRVKTTKSRVKSDHHPVRRNMFSPHCSTDWISFSTSGSHRSRLSEPRSKSRAEPNKLDCGSPRH